MREDDLQEKLDQELDEALARFAAVEPRAGIEQRVLANLRVQRERVRDRRWWRWAVLVTAVVVIVVGISLSKFKKPTSDIVARVTPAIAKDNIQNGIRTSKSDVGTMDHPAISAPKMLTRTGHRYPQSIAVKRPKLAQFPSLRPPNKQEQSLLRYVQQFPQEALMVAKFQAEFEKEIEKPDEDQTLRTSQEDHEEQDQPER